VTQGNHAQRRFTGGELSPSLQARTDIEQYESFLGDSLNVMSTNKGNLINRPGTVFDTLTDNSLQASRLIPFNFTDSESYILEFADEKLIIHRDGSPISINRSVYCGEEGRPNVSQDEHKFYDNGEFQFVAGDGPFTMQGIDATIATLEYTDSGGAHTVVDGVTEFYILSVNNDGNNTSDDIPVDRVEISLTQGGEALTLTADPTAGQDMLWVFDPVTELISPYTDTQVDDIKFAQVGDLVFFVQENHPPYQLERYGDNEFYFHPFYLKGGPWAPISPYGGTYSFAAGSPDNLTDIAAATTVTEVKEFEHPLTGGSANVGRYLRIRWKDSATNDPPQGWYEVHITSVPTDPTRSFDVEVTIPAVTVSGGADPDFTAQANTKNVEWRLFEPLNADGTGGWPTAVAIWDNRLVLAGNESNPTTIAFSQKNDYSNFAPDDWGDNHHTGSNVNEPVTDALDGFVYSLQEGKANKILWLEDTPRGLVAGTSSGIFMSQRTKSTEAYGPENFTMNLISEEGSSSVQPKYIDGRLYYVGALGTKILSLSYSVEADVYQPRQESIFSDHLLVDGIKEMVFARDPIQVLWIITNTGSLVSAVILDEQNQKGFFKHKIAGPYKGYKTSSVTSVAVIPSVELGYDVLYMNVNRPASQDAFGLEQNSIEHLSAYPIDGQTRELYTPLDSCVLDPGNRIVGYVAAENGGAGSLSTEDNHGLSPTDSFQLWGMKGDLDYLNGVNGFTAATTPGVTSLTFNSNTPDDATTPWNVPIWKTGGRLYDRDASLVRFGADDGETAFYESGYTYAEQPLFTYTVVNSNPGTITINGISMGYAYSFGWTPDVYFTTLPPVMNNQLGNADANITNITNVAFRVKDMLQLTMTRNSETDPITIEMIDQSLTVPSTSFVTDPISDHYVNGVIEETVEQSESDYDGTFTFRPIAGTSLNILGFYIRGERGTRR
jgi:hypothetical protein